MDGQIIGDNLKSSGLSREWLIAQLEKEDTLQNASIMPLEVPMARSILIPLKITSVIRSIGNNRGTYRCEIKNTASLPRGCLRLLFNRNNCQR
ncbi:hypothetical protein [Brevibacillus invocatus]|uniref:hypothetical protein n=1 Tax=Brevibacillus TaxID=55080 RepID=UPI0030B811FA